LALRGVGPESEAESVRFHGRRVTRVARKSNAGVAGRLENPNARINLPFQFGVARDIRLPEAKTTKDQTVQKRTEPVFIEPMQGKPVAALPAGEKWVFELKLDGYRCIAAKRGKRSR
jgi:ATP-dependent DNA ligase